VQVPFIQGGAEFMTAGLRAALQDAGHEVEVITMPFRFSPASNVLRSMDEWEKQDFDNFDSGRVDRVIALKFPAFYLSHSNKSVWLMHQHRSVYELFGTPYGENTSDAEAGKLRAKIIAKDTASLQRSRRIYTISKRVSERLAKYNGVASQQLYQPPPGEHHFTSGEQYPYVFFPSRLEALKRQDLLIRAMKFVPEPVVAVIAGDGGMRSQYEQLIAGMGLQHRVKMLGRINDETKRRYYSNALAVFFGAYDEDYGFVTLEGMLSRKPVICCSDSGGPTEFVVDGETGFVTEAEAEAVGERIAMLWQQRRRAIEMGENGLAHYRSLQIAWPRVVQELLGGR